MLAQPTGIKNHTFIGWAWETLNGDKHPRGRSGLVMDARISMVLVTSRCV